MLQILTIFLQAASSQILYLALHLEAGSFPRPLRPAEERAAFAAMQAGDRAARDTLIRHNLRLVAHVAKKVLRGQRVPGRPGQHRVHRADQGGGHL